jgi:peptidoglycan-N-acetylglucosamine deacetylase
LTKQLQITIDDGPQPVAAALTPILVELGNRSLRGAFFVLGQEVKAEAPAVTQAILSGGHVLGNHSWDHLMPRTANYTDQQIRDQFQRTHQLVSSTVGVAMRHWRAPRLEAIDRLTGLLSGPGKLYALSHCDIHADSKDSQGASSASQMLSAIRADIARRPSRQVFRLLFHVKSTTASALGAVLDGLTSDGHTLTNFAQAS